MTEYYSIDKTSLLVLMIFLLVLYKNFNFVDKAIYTLIGNRLIYAASQEDPKLDHEGLQINSNDRIFTLTSGGCNVLDYLIAEPKEIVTVDCNNIQNYFFELKLSIIEKLCWEEGFAIIARSDYTILKKNYKGGVNLRDRLSKGAKKYWDKQITKIDGTNWLHQGTAAYFANTLLKLAKFGGKGKVIDLIKSEASSKEINDEYRSNIRPLLVNTLNTFYLPSKWSFQIMMAVPTSQLKGVDFVKNTLMVFDRMFNSADGNYFLNAYITGMYTEKICPRYLKKENYDKIRGLVGRVKLENGYIADILETYPDGHFTKFSLLDSMDWVDDKIKTDTLSKVVKKSTNPKIWWRSARPYFNLPFKSRMFKMNPVNVTDDLYPSYPGTFLATINHEAIDTLPVSYSPKLSVKDELKTLSIMITYPLFNRSSTLKGKLESFYSTQKKYYDGYRHKMLHGRQGLMTSIPFKAGDTWFDLGGGTGSNLEYIAPFAHLLKKIVIVDLCDSLLDVAKERIKKLGLTNVECISTDVTSEEFKTKFKGEADVVTISYALTMIPNWKDAIKTVKAISVPGSIFGVTDFTVDKKIDGATSAFFWTKMFNSDGVHLNHEHVEVISKEFQMKEYQRSKGGFPYIPLIKCPYYIFIGKNV